MGVGRGRERPGTLAYMTRKGQEEGERDLLSFLILAVVAEHEIRSLPPPSVSSPSAYTDRKREARRIPSPQFAARTRNLFARRQVAYVVMFISVRVSGFSFFL